MITAVNHTEWSDFPEQCPDCFLKSQEPEKDCCEVLCKCDCHLTDEQKLENEKAYHQNWVEAHYKEGSK